MRRFFMLALFCAQIGSSYAKVLIITHSYNQPEFIEWQVRTFKKFFKNEYEFIVFNDATAPNIEKNIYHICQNNSIRCFRIPQEIHERPYLYREPRENVQHSCCRVANVVQYSLDEFGFAHDDLVMIIDSDMFLIRDFDLREYMKECDLAGVVQWRGDNESNEVHYLWNGLLFFNMPKLPNKKDFNMNCGMVEGQPCDTGGFSYYYLRDNPTVRVKYFPETLHLPTGQNMAFRPANKNTPLYLSENNLLRRAFRWPYIQKFLRERPDAIQLYVDCAFLHYKSGSNNEGQSSAYHSKKKAAVRKFIAEICPK